MKPEARKSSKTAHHNHEMTLELLNSTQEESDWLSNELEKTSYQFYKYWLAVSFILVLASESWIIYSFDFQSHDFGRVTGDIIAVIGLLPLLFGCIQMFWAILTKKTKMAQQSLSKFHYSFILSVISLLTMMVSKEDSKAFLFGSQEGAFRFLILTILPISNHFGGTAILRVFKKSHPLERQKGLQLLGNIDQDERDMIEQNEAIESEVSKYDQQFNRYPYLAYRCWLKFAVLFDMLRIFAYVVFIFMSLIHAEKSLYIDTETRAVKQLITLIIGLLSSILSVNSCFQIEAAIRKKSLEKSKRALGLLKVIFGTAGSAYMIIVSDLITFTGPEDAFQNSIACYLLCLGFCLLIPVVTFIGAKGVD